MTSKGAAIIEYEEIRLLKQSEKSTVLLVREKDGEQLFVRKILKGQHAIYAILQSSSHPYLPKVHEVDFSNGSTTILEEYIEGPTLDKADLNEKKICTVAKELCSVLRFFHERGIVHRDIKPYNVILAPNGHIRLIDFDSARLVKDQSERDTRLLVTHGYAPPEQYGFAQTDARADIYSLGMTFKELLGEAAQKSRYRRIIRKCTDLNPDKRYKSVKHVQTALSFQYRRTVGLSIVVALIVIVCSALFYELSRERAQRKPDQSQEHAETINQSSVAVDAQSYTTANPLFLVDGGNQILLKMEEAMQGKTTTMQVDMTGYGDMVDFSIEYDADRQLLGTRAKSPDGIDTGLWYGDLEELLRAIPHRETAFGDDRYMAQITCVDADNDGVKEIFLTRGDGKRSVVTFVWQFAPGKGDTPDEIIPIGTMWGVTTMRLTEQGRITAHVHDQLSPLICYYNDGSIEELEGIYFTAYKELQESEYVQNNNLEGKESTELNLSELFSDGDTFFEDYNVKWGIPLENRIVVTDMITPPYNTIKTSPIHTIGAEWELNDTPIDEDGSYYGDALLCKGDSIIARILLFEDGINDIASRQFELWSMPSYASEYIQLTEYLELDMSKDEILEALEVAKQYPILPYPSMVLVPTKTNPVTGEEYDTVFLAYDSYTITYNFYVDMPIVEIRVRA